MKEEDNTRKQIEEQLEMVNTRLQILDMIENKLLKMKKLAQRVVVEDLTEKEIKNINNQVQKLVKEVELLDRESTQLS